MNEKEKNDLFIKACEKAGLKVMKNARSHVAQGLVVRDAQGRKYTVDTDGQLICDSNADKKNPHIGKGKLISAGIGIKVYDNQGHVFVPSKRCGLVVNLAHRNSSQKQLVTGHKSKRVAGKRGATRQKG